MVAATKAPDAGADFLHQIAAENPANTPLAPGLTADPTYLAFLRGAGFSYQDALHTAFQQMAAARANYATQAQRLPEQLHQAQEATDTGLLDRGVYASGERLVRENRNVVANQQQGQDLVTARASALQGAQSQLQTAISTLARDRADAEGQLQDRVRQQSNQDRYIAAVAGASGGSGGGGGGSYTLPAPAVAPTAPAAPGANQTSAGRAQINAPTQPTLGAGQTIDDYLASQPVHDYVRGLAQPAQANFVSFIQAQHPNANLAPLLLAINGPQPGPGSANPNARY